MPKYVLYQGNVLDAYEKWPAPDVVISDGAYGIRGFEGDTAGTDGLIDWYYPHIEAWSKVALPSTALWFWNTEVGWATLHPLLCAFGWEYVQTVVWDKGLSHIAGNVNGQTIRQYPVVTEVSVLYRRRLFLPTADGALPVKQWLRHEWQRSGLPLKRANDACGVKNAATRKYLTQDWLWYWPPGEAVEKMGRYCAQNGKKTDRPYFSLNGVTPVSASEWDSLRSPWNHRNGLTNVWTRPPLADSERIKGTLVKSAPRSSRPSKYSSAHLNQKPLEFMERQIYSTTVAGGIVWEPFGGLASASVAAIQMKRIPYAAECNPVFYALARKRLEETDLSIFDCCEAEEEINGKNA